MSFAVTSVAMNCLFFFMNIGIVVLNLYSSYDQMDPGDLELLSAIFANLFFMLFATKFFIYFFVNTKFRQEFNQLFMLVSEMQLFVI